MEEDDGLVIRQRPAARADNGARRKQRAMREPTPADWFDPEDDGLRCQARATS
jgi:coiled-coil and C2 domain-containing protein 2A